MTIRRFTVFGQRCSGTNALVKLIETNIPTLQFSEVTGFKHWLVPEERDIPQDLLVIVIAREVSQWLRSLHRNPWHVEPAIKCLEFSQFIRAEWRTIWDEHFWGVTEDDPRFGAPIIEERCLQTGRAFQNPVAMRTAKLRNWSGLRARSPAFLSLSHRDLVSDPRSVVSTVADLSGHRAQSSHAAIASYKGQGNRKFEPVSYEELSLADRDFVNRHIDPVLELQFSGVWGRPYPDRRGVSCMGV